MEAPVSNGSALPICTEVVGLARSDGPNRFGPLPDAARRYLAHAIQEGTPRTQTVSLKMHGEIKIKSWTAFTAEETINADRRMVWNARTKLFGFPVSGFDAVEHGYGTTLWKLLGLIPIAFARGREVSCSAIGRMAAESIWNPSILLGNNVTWLEADPSQARFLIDLFGQKTEVTLSLLESGAVRTLVFQRWGKPPGCPYGLYPFGGYVDDETTFEGLAIPSKIRLGWHFGTDRFAAEGEFFRVTIDCAEYQ